MAVNLEAQGSEPQQDGNPEYACTVADQRMSRTAGNASDGSKPTSDRDEPQHGERRELKEQMRFADKRHMRVNDKAQRVMRQKAYVRVDMTRMVARTPEDGVHSSSFVQNVR